MTSIDRRTLLKAGLATTGGLALGLGAGAAQPGRSPRRRSSRTLAKGLAVPWGMAFLPNGNALVGERDSGDVHVVRRGGGRQRVGSLDVYSQLSRAGESGLLGLALHPGFASNRLVYAYLSTRNDNRIVRMRFADGKLGRRARSCSAGIPMNVHHNGGGLVFGPDGLLYASTGDGEVGARAQSRSSLGGKVLRLTPDGDVPVGQPVRQLHLVDGAPERRGHHLRRARHAVGQRVRREGGRRAQPDRARRQLRLAAGRGRRRRRRLPRPARPVVADVDLLAGRRRGREQPGLARRAARRVPVLRPAARPGRRASSAGTSRGRFGRIRQVMKAPDGSLWITTSNRDGRGAPGPNDDKVIKISLS